MADPFERAADEDESAFLHTLFKVQPRLVPMALAGLAPLVVLAVGGASAFMASLRLADVDQSGAVWTLGMVLASTAPAMAVCLMPVVQRKSVRSAPPFAAYCRWVSIAIVTGFPVLWIAGWLVGPGDPWGRSAILFIVIGLYTTASALFPVAARLNHAAWLRAQARAH